MNTTMKPVPRSMLFTPATKAGRWWSWPPITTPSTNWAYAPGPRPHSEAAPLDVAATGSRSITVNGVVGLEDRVLHSPPIEGFVLRYGQLYGPDTGRDTPDGTAPLHVDAAAIAALVEKARTP